MVNFDKDKFERIDTERWFWYSDKSPQILSRTRWIIKCLITFRHSKISEGSLKSEASKEHWLLLRCQNSEVNMCTRFVMREATLLSLVVPTTIAVPAELNTRIVKNVRIWLTHELLRGPAVAESALRPGVTWRKDNF